MTWKQHKYLSPLWCGLHWSKWVAFSQPDFGLIPHIPGVYRVRPAGKNFLTYIGQTGQSLRIRLSTLRTCTLKDTMPYNDPHTAAPNHWAWRKTHRMEYECSAARFPSSHRRRLGLESYLIWKYRVECGESPLSNLGRFHPNYCRPSNRSNGRRGRRLPPGKTNPAAGPSALPLKAFGWTGSKDWMGLRWVKVEDQRVQGPGLYKILDSKTKAVLYIGQTSNLESRLESYPRQHWRVKAISIWVHQLPRGISEHNRLELENDLLGAYYNRYKDLPRYQRSG